MGVLRPLGRTLPRLPAGPDHPGRTAGPTFEMYYQFGNFVPWREPAWALLSERAAILATRSADAAALPGAPAAVNDAAAAATGIAAQLLAHVPEELRHTAVIPNTGSKTCQLSTRGSDPFGRVVGVDVQVGYTSCDASTGPFCR
jgi:hypothetical protein